jgi:protein-S-isoprenylcysteine O-methyltransferase Ste14
VLSYAVFFATYLYAIGFVGNPGDQHGCRSRWIRPGEVPFTTALLTDLALLGLFAIQHSVMARPGFKRWWTRIVPETAERSTYVLLSSSR